jgi:long-chain acyl-CoA synthetase
MEAKIVDEQGSALPQEGVGELWVRGWPVMTGYYKEPHLTYQAFAEGGWLKTGDIAKFDKEGLLYIVGRKKDMIKVGAEIVFAPEVEEVLHRHPQIKEVAVIGVKDRLRGEVPKAFVVLKENTPPLSKEEIIYFCKEHLAHFKIPHYIEFKEALPKTRTGKIDKEKLKNEFSS